MFWLNSFHSASGSVAMVMGSVSMTLSFNVYIEINILYMVDGFRSDKNAKGVWSCFIYLSTTLNRGDSKI